MDTDKKNTELIIDVCPLCGEKKKVTKDLVCPDCYNLYVNNAGATLASQSKIISLPEWFKDRAEKRLADLIKELLKISQEYRDLQEEVNNEAFTAVKKATNGHTVDRQVFNVALRQKKKDIWKEKGGNTLHYRLETTKRMIAFLEGFLQKGSKNTGQM